MNRIFFDTESCGLVGPTCTVQYGFGDDEPTIHEVFHEPVRKTLELVDRIVDAEVVGWHLSHDWFHIQRLQNILALLPKGKPPTVEGWLDVEQGALLGKCVKPRSAVDVFLFARKGPWQSLMDRKDIRIKRVPVALAQLLADHLTANLELDAIYFTRRQDGYRWFVDPTSLEEDPQFPDVVLRFGASGGLKPLAAHCLGVEVNDYPVEKSKQPVEDEWNPFSRGWRHVIQYHIAFWRTNKVARQYAADDVRLTRAMWEHFGKPGPDDDSALACLVGSARWRGYAANVEGLEKLRDRSEKVRESTPTAPKTVLWELHQRMSPELRIAVRDTRAETLEEIGGVLEKTGWRGGWEGTNGALHPAATYAREVMTARTAEKLIDYATKLITTRRLHPDVKVIGTLSGRVAGAGGLNVTGLPSEIKKLLPLADGDLAGLDGGDFDAFEVRLAAAVYDDRALTDALARGKKMHAIFGSFVYERDYESIYSDEDGEAVDPETYLRSKIAFLAKVYGAHDEKLGEVLGLGAEQVARGSQYLEEEFPGIGKARQRIAERFCSMRQPNGIGSRVEWHEPAEYAESLFGFRRYFTLENRICRALFDLANRMPPEFLAVKDVKVSRRAGRVQTPGGATQSAIFAAAFAIQAKAMRAASNHEIQASGARITKRVQAAIWEHQPAGIHPWVVCPMQEHDSIYVPRKRTALVRSLVSDTVAATVESFRDRVPLLKLDWETGLKAWK